VKSVNYIINVKITLYKMLGSNDQFYGLPTFAMVVAGQLSEKMKERANRAAKNNETSCLISKEILTVQIPISNPGYESR